MDFPIFGSAEDVRVWIVNRYGEQVADHFPNYRPVDIIGLSEAAFKRRLGPDLGGQLHALMSVATQRYLAANKHGGLTLATLRKNFNRQRERIVSPSRASEDTSARSFLDADFSHINLSTVPVYLPLSTSGGASFGLGDYQSFLAQYDPETFQDGSMLNIGEVGEVCQLLPSMTESRFLVPWIAPDQTIPRSVQGEEYSFEDVMRDEGFTFTSYNALKLPLSCAPQLVLKPLPPQTIPFVPALQTGALRRMYCATITNGILYMIQSFFSGEDDDAFYAQPPIAYGVLGHAHIGQLVLHEWIGKVVTTPISDPFWIGSPAHESVVQELQPVTYAPPVHLGAVPFVKNDAETRNIVWTQAPVRTEDGRRVFYKVIQSDAYGANFFLNACQVYRQYEQILGSAVQLPACLVPARLLFGSFAIAVEMDFVEGTAVAEREMERNAALQDAVAAAVVFFAKHRLVYVDIRAPNVMLSASRGFVLIDYDECKVHDHPVTDFATYVRLVRAQVDALVGGTVSHVHFPPRTFLDAYPRLVERIQVEFEQSNGR